MNLLPAVEAAALAQRADRIWKGVMNVVEEHFVPAVLSSQHHGHDIVKDRPGAAGILCEELVPRQTMSKVSDEHPGCGVADASEERHGEHESPPLAERTSERVGAEKPDAGPEGKHEGIVLDAAWNPLAPEFLVALAPCTLVRKVHPPLQGEKGTGVVQAEEVNHGDERHSEQVLVPVGAPWPSPLLQSIVELLGVPAELALDQQVHRGGVMPVVL